MHINYSIIIPFFIVLLERCVRCFFRICCEYKLIKVVYLHFPVKFKLTKTFSPGKIPEMQPGSETVGMRLSITPVGHIFHSTFIFAWNENIS